MWIRTFLDTGRLSHIEIGSNFKEFERLGTPSHLQIYLPKSEGLAMEATPGKYYGVLAGNSGLTWKHPEDEPEGVREALLHTGEDGSYTHLLKVEAGTEFPVPISHEFFEEAYYIQGEMINTRTSEKISGGAYVFHQPGEPHGPFKCLRACVILEFRHYR